jgi:hypothetical protein
MRIVSLIFDRADEHIPVGAGIHAERVSRKTAHALVAEGFSPDDVARACRLAVLVSADERIVSVLHPFKGFRGRHYRRAK